ncbi:metal-dependent transcriptional regulator [Methanolobus halotolerans]|uniref:Transcriptional regulator n=1 Tax=Methanolobus halotolerans TaxID=2052935 RepID=A0A4E0Q4N9_9EURY|nr:metal-dependent transcriptional regulator [Methanolobus halotolerans]TGC08945.1 transcriptional regulator [Methanolobus halotolerans]
MYPERTDEYLETIFLLVRKNNSPARTNQIAVALNVSAPSVTEMIQRLSEAGFVDYRPYYGVELTELGSQQAIKLRHSNRVLRRFLSEVLGIEPEKATEEASLLEHATSDIVLDHICQYMRHAELCPKCERQSKGRKCCNLSQ